MNTAGISTTVILASALCALALPAAADTVAWWHFDEEAPGTTAPADTVASDQAPNTYAHVYTIGDNNAMSAVHENSGDYLPKYAKPFHGLAVYDPVSDTTRTNHAAMKFTVARGGPNPNTNAGRARYGGGLKFEGGQSLYSSLPGTSAFTVEAFVCTTGGVYNLFAPIVGSVNGTSGSDYQNERFALYMRDDGSIAARFATSSGVTVWYDGDDRGKAKVNDGAWHHVALTYDGSNVRIYVDHVLDKKYSSGSDRVYTKTGTISEFSSANATWIGGYPWGDSNNGARKFPGLIDEIRVSNATLTPDQFLRMQPLDMDADEIARVSFTPDEYGVMKNDSMNMADMLGQNFQKAVFRKVSGAGSSVYDTGTKAGAVMAAKAETDIWSENAASFYQETNGVGKANYILLTNVSARIRGNDGAAASYTIELFYKTRKTVRGTNQQRQVLAKFGKNGYINVLFNTTDAQMLYVSTVGGTAYYDTASMNADDGKWHHVAVVVDGTAGSVKFYFDYVLAKTRTGTLSDIGDDKSLYFGAAEQSDGTIRQWYDGWLDDIRVTRRALAPSEFLTTHPVGMGDASLLALFGQDYAFTCASNAAFSVTGAGEARTGGSAPTFVQESRGTLLLDGPNGTARARNEWSVRLNTSRVVFPPSSLFEADAYTVEFWAKLDGIVDGNGAVDAGSTSLAQNVPIMRLVRDDDPSTFDWYIYRAKDVKNRIQVASGDSYLWWEVPSELLVDGKWHHYAFTFEPKPGTADKTYVTLFYDYSQQSRQEIARLKKRVAGHRLMLGEGTYAQPNLVGEFDAVRFSKGVLTPDRFLGRDPAPFVLVVR